jgi:hypothetical protein
MARYIAAEGLDSGGEPEKPKTGRQAPRKRSGGTRRPRAKKVKVATGTSTRDSNDDDSNFIGSSSNSESSGHSSNDELPSNAEVCNLFLCIIVSDPRI